MRVEARDDGWHIQGEEGQQWGPYRSLEEVQDQLDWLENQRREAQRASTFPPAPHIERPIPKLGTG
jgi:hypothetical protein